MRKTGNIARHLFGPTLATAGSLCVVLALAASASAQSSATPASWTLTGSLGTRRASHTATLLPNGKVLVAGGTTDGSALSSAELYDPATGVWSITGSLNRGRFNHTATLLRNGKVLVAGGFIAPGSPSDVTNTAELYDPATGVWSLTGGLNTARFWHSATPLQNGKVLVVGGLNDFNEGVALNSAELYDPDTGTWSNTGGLNVSRYLCTATPLDNGKVLVAGGVDGDFGTFYTVFRDAELYDPNAGTWSSTGSLNRGRFAHTATLLQNGDVLVAGGGAFASFSSVNNSAELYNPATGTWSTTGSLSRRSYHVATPLPDGRVLVAGGVNYGFDIGFFASLDSAEIYDPATGAWGSTPGLNTARDFFTATPLRNGKVLIAGGTNNNSPLSSAELYTPPVSSTANEIDDPQFFVREQYRDFLSREPDDAGLAFWTNEITSCGGDAECVEVKRVNVSAAFFLSIEFQNTGYLVERMNKAAYGDATEPSTGLAVPAVRRAELAADSAAVGQGVVVNQAGWEQQLETNKQVYALAFVQRQRFTDAYPQDMAPAEFVARLNLNTGGALTQDEADALVAELSADSTAGARADVLMKVAENAAFTSAEKNRAFVLMQFFGYLRRDPNAAPDADYSGYQFWLDKLNRFGGDFQQAEMVKAFIESDEYRRRFGS